ncbi:MAG: putative porin, partial [Methylacidiphilales bacterium]|nr:putative porin [Candidatus Methylacidiphilales bacterium]
VLVQKGVLSDRERQDILAKEQQDYSQTAASKISLSSSIKTIQFYGDMRMRYEMRDGTTPAGFTGSGGAHLATGDSQDRNAWRYRLRFGIKGDLYDNFFFGIRASTNPNYDRSGNVTFGHSDAAGPFGKDQSLLAIDLVYLGWHATPDLRLTGGQMPNPFYTTNLVWDDNLNPAGAAEHYDHTFDNGFEVFGTAGQFVYQAAAGNGFTNGLGSNTSFNNTFMYSEQVGFKYNFDKDTYFKAGATFNTYSGTKGTSATSVAGLYSTAPLALPAPNNSPSFFNGPFVGAASAPTTNVSGINDLAVLEVPMEFDFKAWNIPMRFFSDFAYNTDADGRADQARDAISSAEAENFVGSTSTGNVGVTLATTTTTSPTGHVSTSMSAANVATNKAMFASAPFQGVMDSGKGLLDQTAYQIGYEIGQLKKKGDWDGKLYWQSTGYYAVDPNLVDADIFNAATNLQGAVVAVSHNWTDGVSSTLRYAHASPVNGKLATPNVNQDLQLGDIRQYNLFQADLMWKF